MSCRDAPQLRRLASRLRCQVSASPDQLSTPHPPWVSGRMDARTSKLARCAVYTRKSTEYNLDLAFNSLDAQREACEAYIKSQAHEGWRAIPARYDDGAFSGASLERPALQQLTDRYPRGQDRHRAGLQGRPADPLAR